MQDKNQIIEKKLNDISNPVIVELGVNRGRSTKRFFDHIKLHGGKLFSIDIKDCSEALEDKDWNLFLHDIKDIPVFLNNSNVV